MSRSLSVLIVFRCSCHCQYCMLTRCFGFLSHLAAAHTRSQYCLNQCTFSPFSSHSPYLPEPIFVVHLNVIHPSSFFCVFVCTLFFITSNVCLRTEFSAAVSLHIGGLRRVHSCAVLKPTIGVILFLEVLY